MEREKKTQKIREPETPATAAEPAAAPVEAVPKLSKPLDEVLGRAERAYLAYMEAQKEVGQAYRENEVQAEGTLRQSEEDARNSSNGIIHQALSTRDEAVESARKEREEGTAQAERLTRMPWNRSRLISKRRRSRPAVPVMMPSRNPSRSMTWPRKKPGASIRPPSRERGAFTPRKPAKGN